MDSSEMDTTVSGALHRGLTPARAALILTAVASGTVLADLPAAVRAPAVLVFCLAAPGLGTVCHLHLRRPMLEAALVLGVSLSTMIVGSYLLLHVGLWSEGWMLLLVASPAVIGAAVAELRTLPVAREPVAAGAAASG